MSERTEPESGLESRHLESTPRQQQDWILKYLQGGRVYPLAACGGGDALPLSTGAVGRKGERCATSEGANAPTGRCASGSAGALRAQPDIGGVVTMAAAPVAGSSSSSAAAYGIPWRGEQ